MWTIVTTVLIAILLLFYYLHDSNYFKKRGIPCCDSIPFLGSIWKGLLMRTSFAELTLKLYNLHLEAKYIGTFEFLRPVLMIRDPDLIKSITIKNFDHFPDHKGIENVTTDFLFSKNLSNLRGNRWRDVRAMLSPAFTSSKMKSMFILMKECAKRYGKNLASLPNDQRIVELKDTFARYTNDVIATCAFGIEVDSMTNRENKFYIFGRTATNFDMWTIYKFLLVVNLPKLSHILGIRVIKKEIEDFFKELVADTIKVRDEKGIVRPDMIQLMMETRGNMDPGKELTIEDMTAQAFIFFAAGLETTSTTIGFAAYEIGVNEEIQKRLQEEIDQVLEDCNGDVTYEAINNMKYLDAVTNEALRKYPVAVATDRVCMKDFELPPALPSGKPYIVKKGESISIPIYAIHHDPNIFPDPHKFNPDRFLDDPKKIMNSGTFLGFGLGPRMCIGNRFAILELKTLLFEVFANCDLKPCSKTTIPMKLSKKTFSLLPEGGFWFEVQPRNKLQTLVVNSANSNGVVC